MAGSVTTSYKINPAAVDALLGGPSGGVVAWVRGTVVPAVERGQRGEAPRRSNELANDITNLPIGLGSRRWVWRVGNTARAPQAVWVTYGTGIYATRGARRFITPKRARFMVFPVGPRVNAPHGDLPSGAIVFVSGGKVFATHVRGTQADDYLARGLRIAFASL